jgi:2-dehydro-3-deoxy-D-arabinonate dehydratase
MLVYRTTKGLVVQSPTANAWRRLGDVLWDDLFTGRLTREQLHTRVRASEGELLDELPLSELLPPIGAQEVWAAGVTYLRSRTARMEESSSSGGSSFYDLVYNADRPELFFKATPHRVRGQGQNLSLRTDSHWMVPEPEATLAFSSQGQLIGYTIGNDLSSRDIEGENPLYLPQAKTFDACAGLGPGLFLSDSPPPAETAIELVIRRDGQEVFAGTTAISQMKQTFANLQKYLFHSSSFPSGCYLMTGTGIVPPNEFTLQPGDEVAITMQPVGTLVNTMK